MLLLTEQLIEEPPVQLHFLCLFKPAVNGFFSHSQQLRFLKYCYAAQLQRKHLRLRRQLLIDCVSRILMILLIGINVNRFKTLHDLLLFIHIFQKCMNALSQSSLIGRKLRDALFQKFIIFLPEVIGGV